MVDEKAEGAKVSAKLEAVTDVREFSLHLYSEREDREWTVWLDTEVSEKDGLCIGVGSCRSLAVDAALANLAHLTANILKLKSTEVCK